MLFYSYCPECGTESRPFRSEPKDGTPMVCPYCGNTYGYKTRHWMAQRVILRSIFTLVVIGFIINGCVGMFGGCRPKGKSNQNEPQFRTVDEIRADYMKKKGYEQEDIDLMAKQREKNKKTAGKKSITLGVEKIDVKKGLCPGYEWGSGKKMDGMRTFQLNRQLAWDEVEVTYKRGVGLTGFVLKRKGLWNAELDDFIKERCRYIAHDAGKISLRSYDHPKDKSLYLVVTLPKNNFAISMTIKATSDGKRCDLNLAVVNKKIAFEKEFDEENLYKILGFEFDDSYGEGLQTGEDGKERIIMNGIVYESPETKKKEEPESRRSRRMKDRMLNEKDDKKSEKDDGFIDVDI